MEVKYLHLFSDPWKNSHDDFFVVCLFCTSYFRHSWNEPTGVAMYWDWHVMVSYEVAMGDDE